jgi:hypothetical protein
VRRPRLPRPLARALRQLAQEHARQYYVQVRRQLEADATRALIGGQPADAVTARMRARTVALALADLQAQAAPIRAMVSRS